MLWILATLLAVALADDCTVTQFENVATAAASCSNLILDSVTVPGGETLEINLKDGATLTFEGTTSFEFYEWKGPLLKITGKGITVNGAQGSMLHGRGEEYWDGKGSSGVTKPKFFRIEATGGSKFNNIYMKNCPVHCVSIGNTDGLTIDGWIVDVHEGDGEKLGHNTDGFDVSADNTVIQNTVVFNQDDCIVVNKGSHLTFKNVFCHGGHGLSLSIGQSSEDGEENTTEDVNFLDSIVVNSDNAIHVKTHTDAGKGVTNDVTYKNIRFAGIRKYGINIQQDYKGGGSSGTTNDNIPINNLVFDNVHGAVENSAVGVYILCDKNGCFDWKWSNVEVYGEKKDDCNFQPSGFSC